MLPCDISIWIVLPSMSTAWGKAMPRMGCTNLISFLGLFLVIHKSGGCNNPDSESHLTVWNQAMSKMGLSSSLLTDPQLQRFLWITNDSKRQVMKGFAKWQWVLQSDQEIKKISEWALLRRRQDCSEEDKTLTLLRFQAARLKLRFSWGAATAFGWGWGWASFCRWDFLLQIFAFSQ